MSFDGATTVSCATCGVLMFVQCHCPEREAQARAQYDAGREAHARGERMWEYSRDSAAFLDGYEDARKEAQDRERERRAGAIEVVSALMIDRDRIFLQRRQELPPDPRAGRWETPGGKVEPGETAVQALVRELREELDLDLDESAVGEHLSCSQVVLEDRLYRVHLYEVTVDPSLLPGHATAAAIRLWVTPFYAASHLRCVPSFYDFYRAIEHRVLYGPRSLGRHG